MSRRQIRLLRETVAFSSDPAAGIAGLPDRRLRRPCRRHRPARREDAPAEAATQARTRCTSPREIRADQADFAQLPRLFDEAKAIGSLGERPLAVVTAAVGNQRGWRAAQDRLAKLSTNSVHRTVAGATHAALLEEERYAAAASREITHVVQHVRSGRR